MINWTNYIGKYGQSVKDGYKSNAFSPLTWFAIFFVIPMVIIVLFTSNDVIKYICLSIIILIILFAFVMYVVLLSKDPKLLQSEWYRLEDKRLDMVAQQGDNDTKEIIENDASTQIGGENLLNE